MVKDARTEKYLGIVELGHSYQANEARDAKIGWTRAHRMTRISNFKVDGYNVEDECDFEATQPLGNYVTNLLTCMGLQPVSHNLNVGKLLATTVFSTEVLEEYYRKFRHYYGCVVVPSMYGKSVQYDRLKEFTYVGETSGHDISIIPRELFVKVEDFMEKHHRAEFTKYSQMSTYQPRLLMAFGEMTGLDLSGFFRRMKKGVYLGFTIHDPTPFYTNRGGPFHFTKMVRPLCKIVDWWKSRWATTRFLHLCETRQIKTGYILRDSTDQEKVIEEAKQRQYETIFVEDWVSNKREKNRAYYYQNKDDILNEVKVVLDEQLDRDFYLDPSYLSGFFDGDGSIYLGKCGFLAVTFSQCVLNVLLKIQMKYGGMITSRDTKKTNHRIQYTLTLIGPDSEKILRDMQPHSILKLHRIEAGLEYLKYNNKKMTPAKKALIKKIYELQKVKNEKEQDLVRVNWPYIAGLFDAEGCITVPEGSADFCVSIAQMYVMNFLRKIQSFMMEELETDKICIYDAYISFTNKEVITDFYQKVKNYLIVKGYQCSMAMEIMKEYYGERNMRKMYDYGCAIKANKHTDVDYEIDINRTNMIVYVKNKIAKAIQQTVQKEVHKRGYTKVVQAIKKEGILNPHYGHEMKMETKVKSSITNMKIKRGDHLSDENIHAMLAYKDRRKENGKKYLQQEVAEIFSVGRNVVRLVWNGEMLPLDTPDLEEKIIEQKQKKAVGMHVPAGTKISETKRRIGTDEISDIFEWRIKQKNGEKFLDNKAIVSTNIAMYLSEKHGKEITYTMVKNYWSGKTKLRKEHFIGARVTYEEYMELLK